MTSYITKKIASTVLKEHAGNQHGSNDPYFEYVAATDMNGRATGKTVKRKRPVPPGLTKTEEKVLKKVTRRAYRLDNALNICGIKVGWSAVIGLIPFLGDFFDTIMALMVLRTCMGVNLPKTIQSRMLANIVIDFCIGLVPLFGDIGDALWRANTMNAALLYTTLEKRGAERLRRGENPVDSIDEKGSRRQSPAGRQDGVIGTQPMRQQSPMRAANGGAGIAEPQAARTKNGGFLDRFNPLASRERDVDIENAEVGQYSAQGDARVGDYSRRGQQGQFDGRGQETGRTGRQDYR